VEYLTVADFGCHRKFGLSVGLYGRNEALTRVAYVEDKRT